MSVIQIELRANKELLLNIMYNELGDICFVQS